MWNNIEMECATIKHVDKQRKFLHKEMLEKD